MKKYLRFGLAGLIMASFLTGCGGSMNDTELKDYNYYKAHREEAAMKAKWCFEKFNIEEEKIFEEINVKGKFIGDVVETLYPEDTNIVDVINRKNCYKATRIYFKDNTN